MLVSAQLPINAPKPAVWAAITNIENAAQIITGIKKIEIVEKPASGLVGLKWRETRIGGIDPPFMKPYFSQIF